MNNHNKNLNDQYQDSNTTNQVSDIESQSLRRLVRLNTVTDYKLLHESGTFQ